MDTDKIDMNQLKKFKHEVTRFMMAYKFALDKMDTKIDILKQEFEYIHEYNPIEHVSSRLKSPESLLTKIQRKKIPLSLNGIKEQVHDIAGIRITCSFLSDIYTISDMIQRQKDLQVIEMKDYIASPKPNGYRSLHLIVEVPVFMSDREIHVYVEVQIRTIAMDFWASLEHKIFYKYNKTIPTRLVNELKEAAESASALDYKMETIHKEVTNIKAAQDEEESLRSLNWNNETFKLPSGLLQSILGGEKPSS
ncbi:GTP pyrophosphokinase [Halalkalibacter hemicellulosilyticus]|uniref:GTP pyrophosphokinase n=1 Tax=Halalkalibacter hemicellulosilyticusJCM 9152 TaxID=1236971 RepID=W4QGJ2_9BACI|nr:GTP pyrophosphokinase family protein [Halalkalibacter hemicellulosilyticus]GAE31235.1 GTP pyrophosphokinase [Halalkalibacter hemicellulosilyticusJCM 9152]